MASAVAPLTVMFLVFQIFLLKLPPRQVADILKGTAIAAVGLVLFLLGIGIGFLPFGRVIGETVGALDQWWLFVLVCLLVGFFTTWGEPAVRVLCRQVDEASRVRVQWTHLLRRAGAARLLHDESRHLTDLGVFRLAVIEAVDGSVSYWALAHPAGKPDFHHPDGFALQLPPPPHTKGSQ